MQSDCTYGLIIRELFQSMEEASVLHGSRENPKKSMDLLKFIFYRRNEILKKTHST